VGIAVVFPGQGSQAAGTGRPWQDHPAWERVAEAAAAAGRPLAHLLLGDDPAELAGTRESQLSVLLASLLGWWALEAEIGTGGVQLLAGHSLGQITALVASGTVSLADGVTLAVARADASAAAQALAPGGLVALLGADEALARSACDVAPGRAWVANLNGAGQVVVGGHVDVLDAVAERAEALGARRAVRLAVDGAFHTPLMQHAADQLRPVLERVAFQAPRIPVVTNHDASVVTGALGWVGRLTTHLVRPVRWERTIDHLVDLGADRLVEVGPGTTLGSLARRTHPGLEVRSVSDPSDLLALTGDVAGARA
jgi:[acyl-carrier-protein] S-malonyltransferase